MTWEDCGNYWHYKVDQGSDEWLEIRKGRCTGTTNNGESSFGETKDDIASYIAGTKKKKFTPTQIENMKYGTDNEDKARKWYEKKYKKKVNEMGICIPKNNLNIGVSVDGMVLGEDGIIEIKCPQKMYWPLKNHIKDKKVGFSHIWKSHYKQMQMGMGILGKKWCDYVVYSKDGLAYSERIAFNLDYWNNLHFEIVKFWKEYVLPKIENTKYPIKP